MFTIVIPLFNKSPFIERAIQSVKSQKFTYWELIIVDDGSTDDGPLKVESYVSNKIHLIRQENAGVSNARNQGIALAKYQYIAFLDADDFWHPEYLSSVFETIKLYPDSGIWTTKHVSKELELDNSQNRIIQLTDFFETELQNFFIITSGVVLDKRFFSLNEGFNEALTRGEDRDVWYRAICFFGYPVYNLSPLVYYAKEDNYSLMKTTFPIEKHLISVIGKKDYCKIKNNSVDSKTFEKFRMKIVYFEIVKYFNDFDNIPKIKEIISQNFKKYNLMYHFYKLPSWFLFWYFSGSRRKRWFLKISSSIYN